MTKLRRVQSLLEGMIAGAQSTERLMVRCLCVKARVIDSANQVPRCVHVGNSYQQGVEIAKNYALWPLEVLVSSHVPAIDQLTFRGDVPSWKFKVTIQPSRGATEEVESFDCKANHRDREAITIDVLTNSGHSDATDLDVSIGDG